MILLEVPLKDGGAVLLKWGRSTLAFFPMQNTHSGVCSRGILTRHWAFDGSEARHILRGSMHNAQMCNISLHSGADTSVSANRLAPFGPQWSNGTHAAPCMADETGDETWCPTRLRELGQFLLQFAVEGEDLAVALPAAAVVNFVGRRCAWARLPRCVVHVALAGGGAYHDGALHHAATYVPEVELWAWAEGATLQDIALAAERLCHTLLLKIVALDVNGDEDHGYVTAWHCPPRGRACVRAMVPLDGMPIELSGTRFLPVRLLSFSAGGLHQECISGWRVNGSNGDAPVPSTRWSCTAVGSLVLCYCCAYCGEIFPQNA